MSYTARVRICAGAAGNSRLPRFLEKTVESWVAHARSDKPFFNQPSRSGPTALMVSARKILEDVS